MACHSAAPVADGILFPVGQLRIAAALGVWGSGAVGQAHTVGDEQRVVTETIAALFLKGDTAGALSQEGMALAVGQQHANCRHELCSAGAFRHSGHVLASACGC